MKLVYGYIIVMLLAAGCMKSNSSLGRFPEPMRSQMMLQTLMGGVPITLALCYEEKLLGMGIKHPSEISRSAYERAVKMCTATVVPEIKKEIKEAMDAEQAAEAI